MERSKSSPGVRSNQGDSRVVEYINQNKNITDKLKSQRRSVITNEQQYTHNQELKHTTGLVNKIGASYSIGNRGLSVKISRVIFCE